MSTQGVKRGRNFNQQKTKNWVLIFFATNIILMFGRPVDIIPFIALIKPGLLMALLIGLNWIKSPGYKDDFREKEISANFYLIFFGAIAIFWAENTGASFSIFQNQIMYIFGFTIAAMMALKEKDDFIFYLKLWIFINIYISITVISNGGTGTGGIFGDQNDVGASLVMAAPFFYYSALYFETKLMRLICYGGFILCLAAIAATGSRGTFIGLLGILSAIFFLSQKKIRFIVYGGIVVTIALSYLVSDGYLDEIQSINDTEDTTRAQRLYSWGLGVDMFIDNPVLGVGAGQYPWAVCNYQPQEDVMVGVKNLCGRASHSTFVDILSEYGIVGIICFIYIASGCYWRLKHSRKLSMESDDKFGFNMSNALIVSFIGFLSSGAFISILYYPFIWLQIGITIALDRYLRSKNTASADSN